MKDVFTHGLTAWVKIKGSFIQRHICRICLISIAVFADREVSLRRSHKMGTNYYYYYYFFFFNPR